MIAFRTKKKAKTEIKPSGETTETPEEVLENAFQSLREELKEQILDRLKNQSTPALFERIVVDVLVKMGYGGSRRDAGQAIGKSGDEGIDGIIKEDKLGLDAVYIQAKKWDNSVGRGEIQKFVGALQGQKARKGVFITTSTFAQTAVDYAKNLEIKVVLIDGDQLSELMIDHGVGVLLETTYQVHKLDDDYYTE